jgi:uncharacterized membrane protein (UPF0127 family)
MQRITLWAQRRLHGIFATESRWSHPIGIQNESDPVDPHHHHRQQTVDDEGGLRAINVTKHTAVASRVHWAGTSEERRRGLLGRSSIDADEAVYIVPSQWIHMFGMRFAIDVAFLAPDGRVLCVHHRIKPNRLSRLVWRAEGALELAAGTLEATDTEVGDMIELRVEPSKYRWPQPDWVGASEWP